MRKIKILAGVAIALIVVVLGALWLLLDVNRYRPQIQTKVEEQLQRKVTLGNMKLGLFPVRFTVQDVTIAEDPELHEFLSLHAGKQLDIRVSLLPLLSGNVQVNSVDLQEPSVELIRNGKGVWNFASLAKGTAPSAPAPRRRLRPRANRFRLFFRPAVNPWRKDRDDGPSQEPAPNGL